MSDYCKYMKRIEERDNGESLLEPVINAYLRATTTEAWRNALIINADGSRSETAGSDANQNDMTSRIVLLQGEIADLHLRYRELERQNTKLRDDLDTSNQKVERLVKVRKDLEILLEEKLKGLSTLQKSLELQADEYRTLQLQFNTVNKEYTTTVKENEMLINRMASRQQAAAERLNFETAECNRRQSEYALSLPSYTSSNRTSPSRPTVRETVVGIFDQLFSSTSSEKPVPGKIAPLDVVASLPDSLLFRWVSLFISIIPYSNAIKKCSDVDNYDIAFNTDGSICATAGASRKIQLWKLGTKNAFKQGLLTGSNSAVTRICFDNLGSNLLAGGSSDSAVRVWALDSSRIQHTFTGHNSKILCIGFLFGTDQVLLSGSSDRTIKYWDLASRQCCHTICCGSTAMSMDVNSDGILVSSHLDKTVRFWDARQAAAISTIQMPDRVTSIHWKGNETVICPCRDDRIYVYSRHDTNQLIRTLSHNRFKTHADNNRSCLSPDGRHLAIGSDNKNAPLFIWSLNEPSPVAIEQDEMLILHTEENEETSDEERNPVISVAWNPTGRGLVTLARHKYAAYCM